jgi:hypothetical protein
MPEVCGDAALYVDPLSEAAITAAMKLIASDEMVREGLRARGLRHAERSTWDGAARQLLAQLHRLGAASPPARQRR